MGNVLGCKPSPGSASAPAAGGQRHRKELIDIPASSTLPPEASAPLPDDVSIIFVLGGPGSGKGTQCARIVDAYGYTHLSAGDLLRDEVASGSTVGQQCEEIMREGKLVPMEVIIALLRAAMVRSGARHFLIDGFPRALDQAEAFESSIKPARLVLAFDCPEEVMEARLLSRGQTSGRSDDNAATIRKRFATFTAQSLPVIEHYAAAGKAARISAEPHPDEVFAAVRAALDARGMVPAPRASAATSTMCVPLAPGELHPDAAIIFVLGGPGSGKGTQCARIVDAYGYTHLSAGDLLRDEVASGSTVGQQCEEIMREGKLVPMEVTIALLRNAMVRSGARHFLIDGFPRALDQAEAFESSIKPARLVLAFDCPEEVMEARLLSRGQTSGRSDDNAATIRKRFATFTAQSLPVIEHYAAAGKAARISAEPHPDEVFAAVRAALEPVLKSPRATAPMVEVAPSQLPTGKDAEPDVVQAQRSTPAFAFA